MARRLAYPYRYSVYVNEWTMEQVNEWAKEMDMAPGEVIRHALVEFFRTWNGDLEDNELAKKITARM